MRLSAFLLVSLLMLGCGYGSKNYNPGMTGGGAAPTIATLSPASAMHGGSGLTLTINGSNFGTDVVVYWNGATQGTLYVTAKHGTTSIKRTHIIDAGMVAVY